MKEHCLLSFLVISSFKFGYARDLPVKLEYVSNSFPIKIDGGSNFYTYDTTSLDHHKYILVINDADNRITVTSNTRTAFMKVSGNPGYIYLHAHGKTYAAGMDTAAFKGKGYIVKLNTHQVKALNSYDDLYKGSLTIKHNKKRAVIKIQGAVHHDH